MDKARDRISRNISWAAERFIREIENVPIPLKAAIEIANLKQWVDMSRRESLRRGGKEDADFKRFGWCLHPSSERAIDDGGIGCYCCGLGIKKDPGKEPFEFSLRAMWRYTCASEQPGMVAFGLVEEGADVRDEQCTHRFLLDAFSARQLAESILALFPA
jgi:hypothetical protein